MCLEFCLDRLSFRRRRHRQYLDFLSFGRPNFDISGARSATARGASDRRTGKAALIAFSKIGHRDLIATFPSPDLVTAMNFLEFHPLRGVAIGKTKRPGYLICTCG
jgi:hypothetical protein